MMENKCNKTPNKYLDHVYCQSGENKNYMRPNNNPGGSTGSDLLALLKENKQLKAMLILHLDLIQEQSDQLTAKDKQVSNLKEELQSTRTKNLQLENQVQELQLQIQRQIKRAAAPTCELALLSPPPLAKIQCKKDGNSALPTSIIGECNGKLISKIILQRVSIGDESFVENTQSPNSTTTISDTASEEATIQKDIDEHEDEEELEELTTEESNDATSSKDQDTERQQAITTTIPRGAKPKPRRPLDNAGNVVKIHTSLPTAQPVQVCVTPPTPSRGKQMPLMLWHAPNMQSEDDSGSCESVPEGEKQPATPLVSPTSQPKSPIVETPKARKRTSAQSGQSARQHTQRQPQNHQKQHSHKRRCAYITTQQMYATREWEDEDETVCDYEFSQAEAEALHAEAPMLEIPKWTEHDLSPLYCIEGTEDLSDELFLKRHSKLEVDERRRKKWDVQQIREQRRVEKLKRRHYKNELQPLEQQTLKSFYPQLDSLQSICYVSELPVQAFGEVIPKINSSNDFRLPWLQQMEPPNVTPTSTTASQTLTTTPSTTTATTSAINATSSVEIMVNSTTSSTSTQAQQQLLKSTFVFLKKRKRQQSATAVAGNSTAGGGGGGTARQRSLAATKAAAAATATNVNLPTSTSTTTPTTTSTITTTTIATATTVCPTPTAATTENTINLVEENK